MTDNTRAVSLLDAMLNQLAGVSYIVQDPEWLGWSLGAKMALKRRIARLAPGDAFEQQLGAAILEWLATTQPPATSKTPVNDAPLTPVVEVRRG